MSELKPFDDQPAGLSPTERRRIASENAKQFRGPTAKIPGWFHLSGMQAPVAQGKERANQKNDVQKLRTNYYMKASGLENGAIVEFTGKVQLVARILRTCNT
ncbi:hypothetical protein [Candidatus Pantoea multigeneris]|uniref:hypothetical protein n=1 Tax=Candidatus Pantoea multigeneris TaxID=2608357 RepID=UPI0034E2B74C